MRISDWRSDVCSSDLHLQLGARRLGARALVLGEGALHLVRTDVAERDQHLQVLDAVGVEAASDRGQVGLMQPHPLELPVQQFAAGLHVARAIELVEPVAHLFARTRTGERSEEHTSELQSLMRISYAVFCLKKKTREQTSMSSTTMNNRSK